MGGGCVLYKKISSLLEKNIFTMRSATGVGGRGCSSLGVHHWSSSAWSTGEIRKHTTIINNMKWGVFYDKFFSFRKKKYIYHAWCDGGRGCYLINVVYRGEKKKTRPN